MGYACPVCDTPQQDAAHLANHLAFTAMLHGDDHESWLAEAVPEWESLSPADLAPRVAAVATETEYDAVFEDTVAREADGPGRHGHDHGHGDLFGDDAGTAPDVDVAAAGRRGTGDHDEETRAALSEARRMTREMRADEGGETDDASEVDDASEADGDDAGER